MGVETVAASKYEVTTQERWLRPPRSPTIVGSAVETIVWSSAARNMPSISATKTMRRARPRSGASVAGALIRPTLAEPEARLRFLGILPLVSGIVGELLALADAAAADPDGWNALVGFLNSALELQARDRVLRALLLRHPLGEARFASAREDLRRRFEQLLEAARKQGALRADFTLSDLALLFWSFTPLIDATAEIAPTNWRRHLRIVLDGL